MKTHALIAVLLLSWQPSLAGTLAVVESDAGNPTAHKIQVTVANRFTTSFTMRKGFGHEWFDLKNDPGKTLNLAPIDDENGFFWVKISPPAGDSWYCNPPQTMTLLESNPVRLRVNMVGPHMRYGRTDAPNAWNNLWFDLTATLYADGKVYFAYAIENKSASPIALGGYIPIITKSTGKWGPSGSNAVSVLNNIGSAQSTLPNTMWHLQSSNGPAYFQDILMVMQKNLYPNSYWNEGYLDRDLRTSFDARSIFNGQVPVGKTWIHVLMAFSDQINDASTANAYALDYRAPDAPLMAVGTLVKTEAGDRNADGFNEGEGSYVMSAGATGVSFTLQGATTKRVNPAFKIKSWTWAVPSSISVGGSTLVMGTDYNAALAGNELVLQLLRTIQADQNVTIPGSGGMPPPPPPAGAVGTVSNLSAASAGANSATLSFTEANDGTGQPAKYDIRFQSPTISWGSASSVTQGTCATPLAGAAIGATKTCTVLGLAPATAYQFQLIPFRGTLNVDAVFGTISNVAGATTSAGTDAMPPAKPKNLRTQ